MKIFLILNSMKKNYFLIGDTSKEKNWGCYATTSSLINLLNKKFNKLENVVYLEKLNRPKESITFQFLKNFFYYPIKNISFFKIPLYILSKIFFYYRPDYVPKSFSDFDKTIKYRLHNFKEEINGIKHADYVIINGEGKIYQFQRKGRYILFLAYIAKVKYKKKVYLVNHTLDLSNKHVCLMVKNIFPILDFISFRERISLNAYKKINSCNKTNFRYIPDSVLAINYKHLSAHHFNLFIKKNNLNTLYKNKFISIGGSSALNRPDFLYFGAEKLYGKLIDYFLSQNYKILITISEPSDENIFEDYKNNNNIFFIKENYEETSNIINLLKYTSLFITGRWHPSLFAYLVNVPCISLSANTHKMKAFQNLIDEKNYYDFSLSNFHHIINKSEELLNKKNYKYPNLNNDILLAKQLTKFIK